MTDTGRRTMILPAGICGEWWKRHRGYLGAELSFLSPLLCHSNTDRFAVSGAHSLTHPAAGHPDNNTNRRPGNSVPAPVCLPGFSRRPLCGIRVQFFSVSQSPPRGVHQFIVAVIFSVRLVFFLQVLLFLILYFSQKEILLHIQF